MIDVARAAATALRVATLHRWTDGQHWYGEETVFLMPDGQVLRAREGETVAGVDTDSFAPLFCGTPIAVSSGLKEGSR